MKHVIEYLGIGAIGLLMRALPRRVRLACGGAVGGLVYRLDARHRAITLDNVSRAFGDEKADGDKRAIAEGAFRHFGAMIFELISLGRPTPAAVEALVDFEGVERYERARATGKGVILTTAHFGNWEVHGVAHGARLGKIHVLARVQDNRYLNRWLERIRTLSGNEVVYKERALGHMRRLLRDGETIAFMIDQNVHFEDAVFVDFFGRPAATTPVPAWFALKTGAALVPTFCFPSAEGRYRAVYAEPLDCERYRDLDRDTAIRAITQELARVQEQYIREHPEYWLWMHRRWRTRPPDEARASADADETPGEKAEALDGAPAVPELR